MLVCACGLAGTTECYKCSEYLKEYPERKTHTHCPVCGVAIYGGATDDHCVSVGYKFGAGNIQKTRPENFQ